jgi:hypothetical protein
VPLAAVAAVVGRRCASTNAIIIGASGGALATVKQDGDHQHQHGSCRINERIRGSSASSRMAVQLVGDRSNMTLDAALWCPAGGI